MYPYWKHYLVWHTGHLWQRWPWGSWRRHTDNSPCPSCPGPGCGAWIQPRSCGWLFVPALGPLGRRSSTSGWRDVGFRSLCSAVWLSGPGSGWCCWLAPGTPGNNLEEMKHRRLKFEGSIKPEKRAKVMPKELSSCIGNKRAWSHRQGGGVWIYWLMHSFHWIIIITSFYIVPFKGPIVDKKHKKNL